MLLVDDDEPEIRERNGFIKQRVRADDNLRLVYPGSARVPRAGFSVPPKQSFIPDLIILRPNPRIILVLLCHSGVPWIAKNVMELLFQISIRSDITIKLLLFPKGSVFLLELINFMRRERFDGVQQLLQRPKDHISFFVIFLWPRL